MFFSFIGGIMLGVFFFGGLYYTTKKIPKLKNPALIMFISSTLRMSILIFGLYLIFSGELIKLLIGIVGVFVSKYIIIIFVKKGVI